MLSNPHRSLEKAFQSYLQTHHLLAPQGTTLLAVSGGVDSVVLASLFSQTQLPFAIAHVHFGLRGAAADADETLVSELAAFYCVPFHKKRFDVRTYAQQHGISIQMAARTLRYDWFEEVLKQEAYTQFATAHHHQDQLETFLYHMIKGTGIIGLRGMLPKRGKLIRPLLFATKAELISHAQKHRLVWREDASNGSLYYDRNWLRHKVIPLLRQRNPSLEYTFFTSLMRLQQTALLFEEQAAYYKGLVWKEEPPYHRIQLSVLKGKIWAPVILAHWLAPFGFGFKAIQAWWQNPPQSGKWLYTQTHRLLADRTSWILTPYTKINPQPHVIPCLPFKVALPGHLLHIHRRQYHGKLPSAAHTVVLDAARVTFPLTLRIWQIGDRFCPLGMTGHKKLSDFLIDAKVPCHRKSHIYVLTTANCIVWVVGYRIDERYKVTSTTKEIIHITYTPT